MPTSPLPPTPPDTILGPAELEAVRGKFALVLKRGEVIRLGEMLGFTPGYMRDVLAGAKPAIPALPMNQLLGKELKHKQWARDTVLLHLNQPRA